jgi:adenine-specific DNA-methyltransferase
MVGDYAIWPQNHFSILKKESRFRQFRRELDKYPQIEVVYIITDSQNAYLTMIDELRGFKTYQLYRDYLENFRINYAAK